MTRWTFALVAMRALLLLVGTATTAVAFRAYRRKRTRYLRDATVGFGLVSVGVLVEGALYQVTGLSLTQVHIVESVALACGLGVLLRSFLQ